MLLLRQPLFVAFNAVGNLLGPLGVGFVVQSDERCAHYPDRRCGGTVDRARRGPFSHRDRLPVPPGDLITHQVGARCDEQSCQIRMALGHSQ